MNRFCGMSQEAIARDLKVSFSTTNSWVAGKRLPRATHVESIAKLFETCVASVKPLQAVLSMSYAELGAPAPWQVRDPLDLLFILLLELKSSSSAKGVALLSTLKEICWPWKKLLSLEAKEIEQQISKRGFGSIKARGLKEIATRLQEDSGTVSLAFLAAKSDQEAEKYLLSLPSVGENTARTVLMYVFGRSTLPVDAPLYRVLLRTGLVGTSTSPRHVHELVDQSLSSGLEQQLHSSLVKLASLHCHPANPTCRECPVKSRCSFAQDSSSTVAEPAKKLKSGGKFNAIDLYAGCGGLSEGLRQAGFDLTYALDWDKHACTTHHKNFPGSVTECVDVRKITGEHIRKVTGKDVHLVAGGPNCQGVSERGLRNPDDPRNFMFPEFVRIVDELKPTFFLMENVPGLAHRHNFKLLSEIFRTFQKIGYRCAADVLLAAKYGVPQLRYRFFLIGTRGDFDLSLPLPMHEAGESTDLFTKPFVTVAEAIGDLPPKTVSVESDELTSPYSSDPQSEYQRVMRNGGADVHNHICSETEQINIRRATFVPKGGNWKNIPRRLLPDRFFVCRMTDHSTTYARLRPDKPAYTITSLFGNITAGAFTHPEADRALSIREGARIQSFPDHFTFSGPRNAQYRQIGNAVPPFLARAVGEHLLKILQGGNPPGFHPRITPEILAHPQAWDALPVLTPRFKEVFGAGTRWPVGWGAEPKDYSDKLDKNYSLRPEFWPKHVAASARHSKSFDRRSSRQKR
jgi:DNA-cytosine methyltransferase